MSIRQNPRLGGRQAAASPTLRAHMTTAWAIALVTVLTFSPVSVMSQTTTETLGLTRVLEAARNNLDVAITRQAAEAAKADVLSADRSPFPVFSAKTSQMYLDNGVNGNQGIGAGAFGQKNIDKSGGIDWTWERGSPIRPAKHVANATSRCRIGLL
jgi:outer membrane protein, heavy metal efflux system